MDLPTEPRRSARIAALVKKNVGKQKVIVRKSKTRRKSNFISKTRRKSNFISIHEIPPCNCPAINDHSPEYSHLGSGSSLQSLREDLENKFKLKSEELRIEKITFTSREGKTEQGCPKPNWIIHRSNTAEIILVLVKQRMGHHCQNSWLVTAIIDWDGISTDVADNLFTSLPQKLAQFGKPIDRGCSTNDDKSCTCQGSGKMNGATYIFGCTNKLNVCKFRRSICPRKFKLRDKSEEKNLKKTLESLGSDVAKRLRVLAPTSYDNQTAMDNVEIDCRLGEFPGRPWSGVAICADFCAHSHQDDRNMIGGCTGVVTLTKDRQTSQQFHVLPFYVWDNGNNLEKDAEGGVALALSHGSILFEYARGEVHCTTAVEHPNRENPSRFSLVFFQHRNLNSVHHGYNKLNAKRRRKKV